MLQTFRFAFASPSPIQPAVCMTSPYLHQWQARHTLTCGGGEIAHAWQGLTFGPIQVAHVYTDIECSGCHEHYIEVTK